jgi:glycerophosphoryl diester phosphodiesterase
VNDAARLRELAAMGVDGVVTDDPRIFAATLSG